MKKTIGIIGVIMMLALAAAAMATGVDLTWTGNGYTKIVTTAPHVESTIETGAANFNGQQTLNMVDVTETRVSRMSQYSGGGYVDTTDRLTDSDMDNTIIDTYAESDDTGKVSIEDLGWSGTQNYGSYNDDRYGLPWPQTPTVGTTRGIGQHFKAVASGGNAFVSAALGNNERGVQAIATGNSASADGRASWGFNWANAESAYVISGLTLSSS